MSRLYLQRARLYHGGHHVARPFLYSSAERTSQTLALYFLSLVHGQHSHYYSLGRGGWLGVFVICKLTTRCHYILHTGLKCLKTTRPTFYILFSSVFTLPKCFQQCSIPKKYEILSKDLPFHLVTCQWHHIPFAPSCCYNTGNTRWYIREWGRKLANMTKYNMNKRLIDYLVHNFYHVRYIFIITMMFLEIADGSSQIRGKSAFTLCLQIVAWSPSVKALRLLAESSQMLHRHPKDS